MCRRVKFSQSQRSGSCTACLSAQLFVHVTYDDVEKGTGSETTVSSDAPQRKHRRANNVLMGCLTDSGLQRTIREQRARREMKTLLSTRTTLATQVLAVGLTIFVNTDGVTGV